MLEQIGEAFWKVVALLIVGALAWYWLTPIQAISPEVLRGIVIGLVVAFLIYRFTVRA